PEYETVAHEYWSTARSGYWPPKPVM
ncbi:MAG: hypothetical protein QOD69_3535, partial [Solirubrobacteraceae bacterium]|nr:hypothetical protein [Solirubrobacteraceae bacterium]